MGVQILHGSSTFHRACHLDPAFSLATPPWIRVNSLTNCANTYTSRRNPTKAFREGGRGISRTWIPCMATCWRSNYCFSTHQVSLKLVDQSPTNPVTFINSWQVSKFIRIHENRWESQRILPSRRYTFDHNPTRICRNWTVQQLFRIWRNLHMS